MKAACCAFGVTVVVFLAIAAAHVLVGLVTFVTVVALVGLWRLIR